MTLQKDIFRDRDYASQTSPLFHSVGLRSRKDEPTPDRSDTCIPGLGCSFLLPNSHQGTGKSPSSQEELGIV